MSKIALAYDLPLSSVEKFISILYKKFQNVREAKVLAFSGGNRDSTFSSVLVKKYIDSTHINKGFLALLSEDEEVLLSDNEILFAEFLNEYGDEVNAIQKAHLDVGLNKTDAPTYTEACRLRALYLKRKDNVASYIYNLRKRNLKELGDEREYIQSNLVSIIEQLRHSASASSAPQFLKAIELLARTVGAFEDRVIVENAKGDEVLDRLIERAKEAQLKREEPLLIDGVEVYEGKSEEGSKAERVQ